jgi:AcrR family transcriptional regulator
MPSRMTRKEKQARTRRLLMAAAAKVCAKRGLQQTSVDEVAEQAGYTKGAFYANFASKEELFLAMLDERFAERVKEIDRVLAGSDDPEAMARRAGADFARYLSADPEWQRLFFEFSAHAARNPEFREELVTRYRSLRERMAELFRRRAAELGIESPVPYDQLALMTFAMANGFALERLLEPEVAPDELHATMLGIFFTGVRAVYEHGEGAQAGEPAGAA